MEKYTIDLIVSKGKRGKERNNRRDNNKKKIMIDIQKRYII